ncbi:MULTISPECIES: hypothetical protein [Salegentibacter]|uniref:Uncharacterized protein n=1 Tax=Salegentibacter maritimus TaxID=2794347 RepID=A0ABS0TK50_9FLAO|nr:MULTISPECIES: hypothetical protein [Salegentibacter]MBE7641540.1 hypothetical protein [Salegentibacter sp. BLCTC]MBI6117874.1 hypothetical protein [Salegentibacter maritimus]MBI6121447.1 hypothetical protein [Salegentibacter maritimus]
MNEKFQEHYGEEEIQILSIQSEAEDWEDNLIFISEEINFFGNILESGKSSLNIDINSEDASYLKEQLDLLNKANEHHLTAFFDYKNKLEGLKECDDVQCENFYLKDHLIFKNSLRKHFKDLRKLKLLIFKFLKVSFN